MKSVVTNVEKMFETHTCEPTSSTSIIFIPLVSAFLLLGVSNENRSRIAFLSVVGSVAAFFVALILLTGFDSNNPEMQFIEDASWVSMLNIRYLLGVDGISIWMVLLTTFLSLIAVLYGLKQEKDLRLFNQHRKRSQHELRAVLD